MLRRSKRRRGAFCGTRFPTSACQSLHTNLGCLESRLGIHLASVRVLLCVLHVQVLKMQAFRFVYVLES